MQYRSEIDGLRAVAVLPVIFFHAGFELFGGGYVGVDVFFVISGYLITTIIIDDLDRGEFRLSNFYERRARRILPALFLVVLACLPFAWAWLLPRDMKDFSQSVLAVTTFSSNILFWIESGYFDAAAEMKPLLHTWSLAVEEQYYIIFPVLLMLLWHLKRRWVILLLVGLCFASLAVSHYSAHTSPASAFYLLWSRGWELLVGVFVAIYLKYRASDPSLQVSQLGSAVGLALIAASIIYYDSQTPFPGLYALAPTLGTACVVVFATNGTWAKWLLSRKILVGLGLISYSAYLWHQPLLAFAKYRSPAEPPLVLILGLCAATFPLAYLSWRYVEVPFRSRQRTPFKPLAAGLAVFAFTFSAVGVLGHYSQGFGGRIERQYDGHVATVAAQFSNSFRYVSQKWNNGLTLREFDADTDTRNVMLIGDSYAKDLTNAIYESGLSDDYFLSVYHISRICGNVWTDRDLSEHIAPVDAPRCAEHERYANSQLLRLIGNADEIWLASSWQDWHLEYLPETVQRLTAASNARIRVFGRKNFGHKVTFFNYLELTENGRDPYLLPLTRQHLDTDREMRAKLDENIFVDVSRLMCGSEPKCTNGTDDGLIISYDGNHLTKEGAKFLGERLASILAP